MFPSFLSRYYEGSEPPFRSLSDLDDAAIEEQFVRLSSLTLGVQRFPTVAAARHYRKLRLDAEAKVRRLFIEKGGRPVLQGYGGEA